MKVFADQERQSQHNPSGFLVNGVMQPNPEMPERMERLLGVRLRCWTEAVDEVVDELLASRFGEGSP
jgi:hypothetical protein